MSANFKTLKVTDLILFSAEGVKKGSHSRSRSGSRKNRGYSIGLGRSQSGGMSEEAAEDALLPNSRPRFIFIQLKFQPRLHTQQEVLSFQDHQQTKVQQK